MKSPKENPEDVKAREDERRRATRERQRAAEQTASGLTSDYSAVYGLRAMSMFR